MAGKTDDKPPGSGPRPTLDDQALAEALEEAKRAPVSKEADDLHPQRMTLDDIPSPFATEGAVDDRDAIQHDAPRERTTLDS